MRPGNAAGRIDFAGDRRLAGTESESGLRQHVGTPRMAVSLARMITGSMRIPMAKLAATAEKW